MNSCAATWIPADDKADKPSPPTRLGQLVRPAETMMVVENQGLPYADMVVHWLWHTDRCNGVFAHSSKVANFIFYDGHVKSKKWLATLYPVNQNNWQLDDPNPDPANRHVKTVAGCDEIVPAGPDAKEYQKPPCNQYHD